MNAYCDLKQFKSYFQIVDTTYDVDLLDKLIDGSRDVERDCARQFYSWEGTRYFATGRIPETLQSARRFPIDDLQSASLVQVDLTGQGVYTTMDMSSVNPDVFLLDDELTPNKLPYIYVEANVNGNHADWGEHIRRAIKITGIFGYGNDYPRPPYEALGDTVADPAGMTSVQATMQVTLTTVVAPGQTLRLDSEQVFVTAFDTGTKIATLKRAMNGTTAATHSLGTVIYVYRYPQSITHAVMVYAAREWRRRQSAYANRIENVVLGTLEVFKDEDPSYRSSIQKYRRYRMFGSRD